MPINLNLKEKKKVLKISATLLFYMCIGKITYQIKNIYYVLCVEKTTILIKVF